MDIKDIFECFGLIFFILLAYFGVMLVSHLYTAPWFHGIFADWYAIPIFFRGILDVCFSILQTIVFVSIGYGFYFAFLLWFKTKKTA